MATKSLSEHEKMERTLEVHQDYRVVRLNVLYYADIMAREKRWKSAWEISLSVLTLVTFVDVCFLVWLPSVLAIQVVGVAAALLAAVLALITPFLPIFKDLERHARLYFEYNSMLYAFRELEADMAAADDFTPEMLKEFLRIKDWITNLSEHDDPTSDSRKIELLYDQVNREIPPESLWMPMEPAM
jgi:hypothetical protein